MDPTLQSTVHQLINLARKRGVNPAHPVQITLSENDTAEARNFIVVCSYTEPTFSEVPYNCLWLNVNMGSPDFGLLRRRISHVTDGAFRGTWEDIVDMPHLYAMSQIYRFVVENPADLGMDISDTTLPHATTRVMGVVTLQVDHPDTEAVSGNDPRMTDARYPTVHDHPDYPRSKIKINATQYALVEGNKPNPAAVLTLYAAHPTDRDVFLARWTNLKADDVEWTSPRLERLVISLPGNASFMNDNGSMDLIGTAVWSNRTEVDPVGLEWSIAANNVGVTIDPVTGVVTAPKLQFDTDLKVSVKLFDVVFNKWVTADYTLRIIVKAVVATLVSIEIVGPSEMFPADQTTFGVVGHYSDGTSAAIVPDTFAGNNNAALSLTQYIGIAGRVTTDTIVTLSAVKDGLTDTHEVLIHKFIPVTLTITGPAVIDEHTSATYLFTVAYNDGTQEQTTVNTFTVDNPKATVTGAKVDAGEVAVDEAAKLTATKSLNGATVTATKNITLRNVSNPPVRWPESIVVSGALQVNENSTSQYTAQVAYNDGTFAPLNQADVTGWTALVGTISNTGLFSAPEVITDTPSKVTVNATVAGYAITGFKDITIRNVPVVVPDHIVIAGPISVVEGSITSYSATLHYSDSTTRTVSSAEMQSWTVTGGSNISTTGALTAKQVTADEAATITLNALCDGVALTDTHNITIRNVASVVPDHIVITGPLTVNEGSVTPYQADLYYSDGSVRSVSNGEMTNWAVTGGSTISALGVLTAKQVTADEAATITLNALCEGVALSDTHAITVRNIPVIPASLAILGSAAVNENTSNTYTGQITMSDGSKVTPDTITSWTIKSGVGSITAAGVATWPKVLANSTSVVELKASHLGQAFTATLTVTIANLGNIVSVILKGPVSINEGQTGTYTMEATLEDGSKVQYPAPSLSFVPTTTAASISGNVVTAAQVSADVVTNLRGTINAEGTNWTADLAVTIKDIPVTLSSISISGPASVNESTSAATYTCTATMSNSTTKTVTPTWSIIANGGISSGLSISAAGVLTVPAVNANTQITIQASYTEGGQTRTATKVVTITDVVVVTAKALFGIVTRVSSPAGFNAAFLASLTTELTSPDKDLINLPAGSSTTGNNKYGYVALPKATHGYAYVRSVDSKGQYGFAGSWDGAMFWSDDQLDDMGPWEGSIGGVAYNIYRNDFPFEGSAYKFEFQYHSSDPLSMNP